ncbi:MAG: YqgE/AlgH family protein [Bacteroidota bacterium]|nr:YqgE/AlgH family protein [Bacteroidota bacterium]
MKPMPNRGVLLLSEPFMMDINFIRSVILLVEHNERGTIGFVLNQPINLSMRDAMEDFPNCNPGLFKGGPCETNTLHYIHTVGHLIEGSTEIMQGIFWGGDHEQMLQLFREGKVTEKDFRFFIGYSGWTPGQLEKETESKSWITAPANFQYLFNTPADALWRTVLKSMGDKYSIIADAPLDPGWN